MPPNDSQFWNVLRYTVTLTAIGLWLHFGYANGFDWKTDGPTLLMLLGLAGGGEVVQKMFSPKPPAP